MSDKPAHILVEVCVGSAADVAVAAAAGADRVELCGAMELGGLTPSLGAVETVLAASSVPVVVMLRPRAGGFCYDRREFAAMLRDATRVLEAGAAGIVFGVLDRSRRINVERTRELIDCAGHRDAVFHRAFDFVTDWRAALDALIDVGCTRVLTSGGAPTAMAGAAMLREMIGHATGRIEVLPGGGIGAASAAELVRQTSCTQVHVGASGPAEDGSAVGEAPFELVDARFMRGCRHRIVDAAALETTMAALRASPSS
jgi:copper homeostasis protein